MVLSGDQPRVAVALPNTSRTLQLLLARGQFGVSVLGADQAAVARRFASGLPLGERFEAVPWTPGANSAPLVEGSISTLACALERETSAGDHVVVFGRVVDAALNPAASPPLLYHRGTLLVDPPPGQHRPAPNR